MNLITIDQDFREENKQVLQRGLNDHNFLPMFHEHFRKALDILNQDEVDIRLNINFIVGMVRYIESKEA